MVFFVCLFQYFKDFPSLSHRHWCVLCLGLVEHLGSVYTFHQIWHFLAVFVLLSLPVLSFGSSTHADFCSVKSPYSSVTTLSVLNFPFLVCLLWTVLGVLGFGFVCFCLFLFCSLQVCELSPAESTCVSLACPVCVSARMLGLPPRNWVVLLFPPSPAKPLNSKLSLPCPNTLGSRFNVLGCCLMLPFLVGSN